MQEAQSNLQQAALDFLAAAEAVAAKVAQATQAGQAGATAQAAAAAQAPAVAPPTPAAPATPSSPATATVQSAPAAQVAPATSVAPTPPAAQGAAADPLAGVSTDLFGLGDLKPSMTPEEFEDTRQRLSAAALLPSTIVELVALARQVGATLMGQ
jgi:hypothetical protein